MTDIDFAERRLTNRRQPVEQLRSDEPSQPVEVPDTQSRRHGERRIGERRKENLGPPPSTGERRFCPDLRGVAFPLYYSPH